MRASNRSCSQDLPHTPSRRPGKTGKNPRTTSNYPKRSKMKPQAGPKRTSKAFCNVLKALKPTKQNTSVDQVGGMRRQPVKCAAAGLSPALTACQTIHNVQQSLPSCITKVMHNAYAFAEEPTPYCPFLTGTHKRYVAGTHSLCSETSVLRKKCVFTTTPEVLHSCRRPAPRGEWKSYMLDLFLKPFFGR